MIPPEIGWLLIGALIGFIVGSLVTWQLRGPEEQKSSAWDTTSLQRWLDKLQATAPQVVASFRRPAAQANARAAGRRSAPVAVLRATNGLRQGETFLLRPMGTLTIGRAEDADIVLNEEGVSRFHAQITHHFDSTSATEFALIDYSRNGTLLNGRPVNAVASLQDGDLIQVGSTTFVFQRVRMSKT